MSVRAGPEVAKGSACSDEIPNDHEFQVRGTEELYGGEQVNIRSREKMNTVELSTGSFGTGEDNNEEWFRR